MGKIIDIPIVPAKMASDVVEDALGFNHQRVENLRQIKKGEWELVTGRKDTHSGLTNLKAGVEVTEDVSGDRFYLLQVGTTIQRIDYDISNSPNFGYESETPTTLTLPPGVTIASTDTLKFFVFRGIVRISGASEPMWYGYVDRTVFPGDDSFAILGWKLEKAILQWNDNDLTVQSVTPIAHKEIDTVEDPLLALFIKFFYVFDNSQYQLLRIPDTTAITNKVFGFEEEIFPLDDESHFCSLKLQVPGASLKNNMFNNRITGLGLAFTRIPYGKEKAIVLPFFGEDFTTPFTGPQGNVNDPRVYREDEEPFFVPEILTIFDITEKPKKIGFALPGVNWNIGTPTQLEISDPEETWSSTGLSKVFLPPQAGFLGAGVKVKLTFGANSIETTVSTVTFGNFTTKGILTLADDVSSVFGATGVKLNVSIVVTFEWQYVAGTGYFTYFGLNMDVLGTLYEEFVDIPIGTLENTPNWQRHIVVGERGLVSGHSGDVQETIQDPVTIVSDLFDEASLIQLEAHNPDIDVVGGGWSLVDDGATEDTAAEVGAGTGTMIATTPLGSARSGALVQTNENNVNIILIASQASPNTETTIFFRYNGSNSFLYASFDPVADSIFLFKVNSSGAPVQIGTNSSVTIPNTGSVIYEVRCNGSSLQLYVNSTLELTVVDDYNESETRHGIGLQAISAGAETHDSFQVTTINLIKLSAEEDTVRYSPIGQFDNFPISNIIQTEAGDTDEVLNLSKRDNSFVILKKKSISQGVFTGDSYSENITVSRHGLLSTEGVFVATLKIQSKDSNEFLFLMDEDDVYLFDGITAFSFFEQEELREFYKSNVTSSSFMLLDKLNNEIWFFLGTEILVWRMHTNEFYIRNTDITGLFGFLDFDNKIIVGHATGLVTYNHGLSPVDELMSCFVRTKVIDIKTSHRFKKLKELQSYLQSNGDLTITFLDVQGAKSGVTMAATRGVVDHWIGECQYIHNPTCYALDYQDWHESSLTGRNDMETISSGVFEIGLRQAILNNRDVVDMLSPNGELGVNNFATIFNSQNNSAYAYMHAAQGWHAFVWFQVATTLPTDHATIWGNDSWGAEIAGFQFATLDDAFASPNALDFRITSSMGVTAVHFDTGAFKVNMGGWNFVIVSWEETTGRNGVRMNFNGNIIDKDNTIFTAAFTSNLSVRPVTWGVRAGTQSPKRSGAIKVAEAGAGNVGLTNAEMDDMADHIENYYALPSALIPLKINTITSPTLLEPRIITDNYLFKELYIEIKNVTDANNLTATIRDFLLRIEAWQRQ